MPNPGRFTPEKKARYRFTGVWVGPRTRLDRWGKSRLHLIPGSFSPKPIAIPKHAIRYLRIGPETDDNKRQWKSF
jgi:hypothetical protein